MGGTSDGGGRVTRALRLLLLFVLALATVQYLYASTFRTVTIPRFVFTPPWTSNSDKSWLTWPQSSSTKNNPEINDSHAKNTSVFINKFNITEKKPEVATQRLNVNENITVTSCKKSKSWRSESEFIAKIMKGIKDLVTTDEVVRKTEQPLPLCSNMPPDLGPVPVNKTYLELYLVEKKFPEIQWGGRYAPPNCTARYKVAIIVPYRDREQHLSIFLNHMHPFLMKQQIEYGIFIVEQLGNKDFNRAKLMNVGFVESQRLGGWQCFVFHDIDLLPLDTRNLYSCPLQPRHMSISIDHLGYKLPYEEIFGGVSAFSLEQFTKVNGFSNKYWGWGGEDDDMFYRLMEVNYHIARYKMSIARYVMLNHKQAVPNPKRYQLMSHTSKIFQNDGLSTLDYDSVQVIQYHLYTHILANIGSAADGCISPSCCLIMISSTVPVCGRFLTILGGTAKLFFKIYCIYKPIAAR